MARYASYEEQYQCPHCGVFLIFSDFKRYHYTIICPNCIGSMGSFGVPIGNGDRTFAFVERRNNEPMRVTWDITAIENLEQLTPMEYLGELDRAEGI